MEKRIPIYRPDLSGNESKYVNQCLDSTWISSKGSFIPEFESNFADFCESNHAIAVSNGTVALHVALEALDIGPKDEVIVPTLTYISSVNAISYTGAKPVFVDSVPETWQLDPKDIINKITPSTKAIMAVHLYGHPAEMDTISSIADQHDLKIIEDCAEAIGTRYKGKHVGNFGDVATFSFFGNKTITTGEGGMVTTNNEEVARKVAQLKGQGLSEGAEYWHEVIGYNYRMTNICAAIGVAQLESVQQFIDRKQRIAEIYSKSINARQVELHQPIGDVLHSYWMCSVLLPSHTSKADLRKHLAEDGIETRPVFPPVHTMPMYNKQEHFLVAEDISARGINLPSYPGLSDEQVEYVADGINKFYDEQSS